AFYKGGKSDTARSAVSKPTLNSLTARPDQPINLQATISGDDTAYVYYFVGQVAPADPHTVQILSMDYLYPPGAALNDAIPTWSNGDAVQLTWHFPAGTSATAPMSCSRLSRRSTTDRAPTAWMAPTPPARLARASRSASS